MHEIKKTLQMPSFALPVNAARASAAANTDEFRRRIAAPSPFDYGDYGAQREQYALAAELAMRAERDARRRDHWQRRWEALQEQIGIPLFRTDTDLLPTPSARDAFFRVLNTPGKSLALYGETGQGKTRALAALAAQIHNTQPSEKIIWIKDYRFGAAAIHAAQNGAEDEFIDAHSKAPFLIWDDFGKSRLTPSVASTTFAILAERFDAELPTYISTQYKISQIASRFAEPETGSAIARRIREFTTPINFSSTTDPK